MSASKENDEIIIDGKVIVENLDDKIYNKLIQIINSNNINLEVLSITFDDSNRKYLPGILETII